METIMATPPIDKERSTPQGFLGALPNQAARDCFAAWRKVRASEILPLLRDFAPQGLPPAVIPWILVHRLRPDDAIVYGLVGEELIRLFGYNPKGEPVLGDIDPQERAMRLGLVRRSLDSGLPFWFTGSLALEEMDDVPVGRLCLPARDGTDRVLILIYFLLRRTRMPKPRAHWPATLDQAQIVWCEPSDLAS
jgi:hypothetical protein